MCHHARISLGQKLLDDEGILSLRLRNLGVIVMALSPSFDPWPIENLLALDVIYNCKLKMPGLPALLGRSIYLVYCMGGGNCRPHRLFPTG